MSSSELIPCNPNGGKIHLSEDELKSFTKGGTFPIHHIWPVVADQFNIKVMKRSEIKRKPKPVNPEDIPKEDEDDGGKKKKGKDKKKPKKKKKKKKKRKKKKKGDEDDGPPPIEDIPLFELAPCLNEDYSTP